MATTTTGTSQTSSTDSGGNKNINILNTGANAVITVGCGCGDSGSGSGSGATDDFQTKPTTDDCENGKIILLETGDEEGSEIAAGYSMLNVLKSKLTGGVHTLQFALCGGAKAVEIPLGVEDLGQTKTLDYEAEYTDGKSTYTGDFLTGAFCLLRAKVTSTEAFRVGITVFNTGCGSEQQQDCQYGIINIFKGAMVGKAAFGTPFTIVADSQNKVEFALCDGEKKLTDFGFLSAGQPITVWVDDQYFETDAAFHDAMPICGTNFAITNCKSATFTIKNEICGTECTECAEGEGGKLIIPDAETGTSFLNPEETIITLGARPAPGGTAIEYTYPPVTIQLSEVGQKDCLYAVALMWHGSTTGKPAWNAPGWSPGFFVKIGVPPTTGKGNSPTVLGYELEGNSITLTVAEKRENGHNANYFRISRIDLGVCQ